MVIAKEFYLDLSQSDEPEETNVQELSKLYGSVNWKDQEVEEYQRNSRNEW